MSDAPRPGSDTREFEEALRARIEKQLGEAQPDFEDLMLRVEHTREDSLDALDAISAAEGTPTPHDPGTDIENRRYLRPYVQAYRGRLDESLAKQVMPVAPRERKGAGVRGSWWLGLVAAVAATVLAWVGLRSGLGLQNEARGQLEHHAVDQARESSARDAATTSAPRTHTRPSVSRASATLEEPPKELAPIDSSSPATASPSESKTTSESEARRKTPARRASIDERIARLDAAAQAAWRRGDRRAAMTSFQKIIDIGGGRPAVELAYGELFALGRQLGESPTKLWKAYLRRFPKGRYAEDAKAGLCRRMSGTSKSGCWREYLEDFPAGSHISEAALEGAAKSADPPPP
jgi:hypothetical protein